MSSAMTNMLHMKQPHGLDADDKVTLEGPSHRKWRNPPQPIEVPSNDKDNLRCRNPYSSRMSNNLHDRRGSSSSLTRLPLPSGNSRSNPSAITVVPSRHFSSSGADKHNPLKDNDKKKFDSHSDRPVKRRKTDIGGTAFINSFSGRPLFSNGQSTKSMAFMQSRSPVIDLVDEEDVGEPLPSNPPPAMTISSPLTPTVSSDDIGLRSKHPRARSPSVSEFTGDVSRPISPVHSAGTNDWIDQNTSHGIGSKGKEKSFYSTVPNTQRLMERYEEDLINNTDDFDHLNLTDDTSTRPIGNEISRQRRITDIPRGFVRNTVDNIEARTGSNEPPPHVDLEKLGRVGIVRSMKMKTKNSEELRRTSVEGPSSIPKPPSKVDRETSTTNFVRKGKSKANNAIAPLAEYIYNGRVFTTTTDEPYSVRFTEDEIIILHKESVAHRFPNFSLKEIIRPSEPQEFKSTSMVVFWFASGETDSSADGGEARLGLKFAQITSSCLSAVWNAITKINRDSARQLVRKDGMLKVWPTLLEPGNSANSHPFLTNSPMKKAKPRPIPIQRPLTRLSSRGAGGPSNGANHARKSPSPSHEELILVYPPSGTGALNITYGDLRRLEPGEFLNDILIEFGLKLWLNDFRNREPELAEQVHVFSSFFYTQLHQKNLEEGYQNVRKWTSRVDIFKKKYIIVPINENFHWYLAIICHPGRLLQNEKRRATSPTEVVRSPPSGYPSTAEEKKEVETQTDASTTNDEDSSLLELGSNSPLAPPTLSRGGSPPTRSITRSVSPPDPVDIISDLPDSMEVDDPVVDVTAEPTSSDVPHIFTFDSLGSRHPHVLKTLNSYLHMEAKDKKDSTISINAHTAQALVPTQPNSCDCGIYLLHFVEQFMSDPERFIKSILNKPTRKLWSIVKSEREQLWNAAEVAGKRQALKEKVLALSAEWKQIRRPDDKGKGKEEAQPSGPSKERDEDSDIEVLEVTAAPSTNKPNSKPSSKQKVQRLR